MFLGGGIARDPARNQRNTQELLELYQSGKVRPYISETFPLARGAEAIAHLASRKALGKVVVTMD